MNIMHVDSECSWRGGEQQLLFLAKGLYEKGHKVIVVCQPRSELLGKAEAEGSFRIYPVKMRCEFDVLAILNLAKIIKREGIEILHLHSAHAHTLGVVAAKCANSVKVVISRRVDFQVMKNPASWIKYNYGFDKIIAISQGVRNVLIGCGVKKGKITTIHSGIDMKHFTTAVEASYLYKEFNLNKTHPRVGIIAALAPHKDHENFLQAATIVKETLPTTKFLIVGEGKLKGRITKRISELNLEDSVILAGFRKDVREILSILDCFVLSSYEEGLGLSLLEAQAVGVPVVATRTGGIPEIIEDGVSGLLVPPRNPQALAKGIITLLSDKKLAARISERAKRDVEKFDFQRTIDETEKLYRELLDEDTLRFPHNSSK